MKTPDQESGYIRDTDLIDIASPSFSNITVLRSSAMSITALGERYGRIWFLKSVPSSNASLIHTQRIKKEFEILSRLHHIGIVRAISIETVDGLGPSIVMEWIEGVTLEDKLSDAKLTKAEKHRLARDIVEAVAFMHAQGIVHRDLKPSNIMIRKNGGSTVIVDFGLADTDSHILLKQPGGTPGYMSPEATSRHQADTRDDVFALGKILRELSVGFGGVSRKCLMPEPKRFADAGEVKAAMLRVEARKKLVRYLAVALSLIVAFSCLMMEISSLREKRDIDTRTIENLNDSVSELRASIQSASRFQDSIVSSHEEIVRQQEEMARHQSEINAHIGRGVAGVKKILNDYDSIRLNTLLAEGKSVSDVCSDVTAELSSSLESYLNSIKGKIPEADFNMVFQGVWQQETQLYYEWQKNIPDGY